MVTADPVSRSLKELLGSRFEWLAIRARGRTLPLRATEIEVEEADEGTLIGFVDEHGFATWRVHSYSCAGSEIVLNVSAKFHGNAQELRLVPRESAAELSANIEFARLARANQIAKIICSRLPGTELLQIALNAETGRLAQIAVRSPAGRHVMIMADVTDSLTHETLLAKSLKLIAELRQRKRDPIDTVWIVGEKRQTRNLQKLRALLNSRVSSPLSIFEISSNTDPPSVKELRRQRLSELWREKPKKITLPAAFETSETARRIVDRSPDKIDIVYSRQGETLRYLGLPFARVRRMMGHERAWLGIDRDRRHLDITNLSGLDELLGELEVHRNAEPRSKRHELFRLAPEAWLESILRRNIKLLDDNLILSPIYSQFRASNDKIDLLAVRKDGRLVIIELKTSPDREAIFQAVDYWRKIELQRRRGEIAKARLFGDRPILDKPALVYTVAPALSFHRDFEEFARYLAPEIELWRWELHEKWRAQIKVLARRTFSSAGTFE
jgi:hypothetical protein